MYLFNYLPKRNSSYLCHRSGLFAFCSSASTGRTLRASPELKRFRIWRGLPGEHQWHLRILLCWLRRPMVQHLHLLLGPVTYGCWNHTAVHTWARVHRWKCAPKVVTSLSRCFLRIQYVRAWVGFYFWRLLAEYLYWRHTGKYKLYNFCTITEILSTLWSMTLSPAPGS